MPRESLVRFGVPKPGGGRRCKWGNHFRIYLLNVRESINVRRRSVTVRVVWWVLRKNRLSSLNIAMMNNWKTKIAINLAGWWGAESVIILF